MNKFRVVVTLVCFLFVTAVIVFGQPHLIEVLKVDQSNLTSADSLKYLNLPERSEGAVDGSEFVKQVTGLAIADREKIVVNEILAGNVPSFSRSYKPVKIIETVKGKIYEVIFYSTTEYMAIGSDQDYLYMPMTPSIAQYVADKLSAWLPTKKCVDLIYAQAAIKLNPQPIPPSDTMTSVTVFWQHTDSIKQQISQSRIDRSAGQIFAGHKKDIVISNEIYNSESTSERVVIYGWHLSENHPIQPLYNGHIASYADYSHGVRLIADRVFINGAPIQVDDLLKDPNLSALLSDEGIISKPNYPASDLDTSGRTKY